jgi:hypothetical protein
VGDEFEVGPVHVAPPDGPGLAVGVVRLPFAALAVTRLQSIDALVADGEVQLAVRPDIDAVDAVVVVEPAKAGEELLRRAVRLAVAVAVPELEDVGRLADEHAIRETPLGLLARLREHANTERRDQIFALVENGGLIGFPVAVLICEDDDPVALFAKNGSFEADSPVIDPLAHPDATQVIDVN